jgi:O-antigen ligase
MVVLCLACYFIVFLILEHRLSPHGKWWRLGNANLWLAALVGLVLLRYAFAYQTASRSTQVPVLLAAIVFGKAISAWITGKLAFRHLTPSLSPFEAERVCAWRTTWLVSLLICLFACTTLWQPNIATVFQYHGISRWSGVGDNPNLYGSLMGGGVVLSFGFLILNLKSRRWWLIPILIAMGLCGIGLFKSYSRGAWFGTACALGFLVWRAVQSPMSYVQRGWIYWLRKNRLLLFIILVSVCVLSFWHFRFSEALPVQRAFSAANANDFSWRNRVTAWEGALRMMRDRPFIGFGWGQAETVYDKKYCPLPESAAIEMNDYFMLGISAGVSALVGLLVYIWLCFKHKSGFRSQDSGSATSDIGLQTLNSLQTTCRAGAIVLLIGFWFDGGLFKLPTATVFWMLMELSRVGTGRARHSVRAADAQPNVGAQRTDAPYHPAIWLRWSTGILGSIALVQTVFYLGTPSLPVTNKTISIARKYLVPPKEIGDFDFLSENPIWLQHVDLANYNRTLINWQLDDKIYQDYVLSPVILSTDNSPFTTALNWRRPLWEEFYPRIRHESLPEDAARIVVRHLRERVTIATTANPSHDIPTIWLRQRTDATGFQIIYVAALRSVGVPARLNASGQAEFWDGRQWQTAPLPVAVKMKGSYRLGIV